LSNYLDLNGFEKCTICLDIEACNACHIYICNVCVCVYVYINLNVYNIKLRT